MVESRNPSGTNAERVLVLPRRLVDEGSSGNIVWLNVGPADDLVEQHMEWMDRPAAEASVDMMQPIPCAVLVDGRGRCCVFERPPAARRVGRLSLVVGGHIEEQDARETFSATVAACLTRELAEEVELRDESPARFVGAVFDDRSIADSRHIGYIHVVTVSEAVPRAIREFDMSASALTGRFIDGSWLERNARHFDPWSYAIILQRSAILPEPE